MKKIKAKLITGSLFLSIVSIIGVGLMKNDAEAFYVDYDFCKDNPSKNTMACEQQCPGQVECTGEGNDCYGHGNDRDGDNEF